ncbi:hypothetical protein POV27_15075 [Aureisphaera galaxeae]|uniref:hypothetical protein n=1 Tax=Aureisphaera galaxeae TaxID=1538023 RepID=UPI00234FD9E6|nr:hypothetical protein [Aureisphaera galaxeae]MDC8005384.1 hypothetical protein [Aureisphaera galaxeae]
MYRITCYKEDCDTPYFYVDPKGGRIPITEAPDTSGITFAKANIPKMKVLLEKVEEKPEEEFSEEDKALLKEWCKQLGPKPANNTGKTKVETEEDVNDYLVVYCDNNHKNYVPFYNPKRTS